MIAVLLRSRLAPRTLAPSPDRNYVWLIVPLLGMLVAPIWLSPVLVTTDGPGHLYNAAIAREVRLGLAPFAEYHTVNRDFAPQRATGNLLEGLLAFVDPEIAERLLASLIVLFSWGMLWRYARAFGGERRPLVLVLTAWLAQSWFLWMGFYDFSLSIAWFCLLAIVLQRARGALRFSLAQIVLLLLFTTHLFSFAVGVGLTTFWASWELFVRRKRSGRQLVFVPGLLVLFQQLIAGPGTSASRVEWADPVRATAGLLIGDFLITFHLMDVLAGVALMATVWTGAWTIARMVRQGRWSGINVAAAFGIFLLAASLVVPEAIGEGSYIPARLRIFGSILLLPAGGAAMQAILGHQRNAAIAAVLTFLLVLHSGWIVLSGYRVAEDLSRIETLLNRAEAARSGSWIYTVYGDWERGNLRISAYRHLSQRAALRNRLIALDNYEAGLAIFPVNWSRTPDWVEFRSSGSHWLAEFRPGIAVWPGPLLVIHERNRPIHVESDQLSAELVGAEGPFSITRLSRLQGPT